MVRQLWRQRDLILGLTRREVAARYKGSILGSVWAGLLPLAMLLVYTFVFTVVFDARLNVGAGDAPRGAYAVFLFSGLAVYAVISEVVNRSPGLLLENVAYIKKVAFPVEIMPVVCVLAALFNAALSFVILGVVYVAVLGAPPWSALAVPLYVAAAGLIALGLGWAFAGLGVYLRDIRQLVGVATTALMFLSPVFYPLAQVPAAFRPAMHVNPLTPLLEGMRAALFEGTVPLAGLAGVLAFSILVAIGGRWLFGRLREGFADVV
jgi:lipopolysaccharide transport system permease protein